MKNLIRLIISIMMISAISQAQVAGYYFTQMNGTYTPLATETPWLSGTFDNDTTTITIPSFTINGTAYTRMTISTNGFVTFGGTHPIPSYYTPISGTTAYHAAISPFGLRLQNAASGTPKISYNTNDGGEIVVQWQDVKRYTPTGDVASFQIRLNPANGMISIIYGSVTTSYASTSYPVQVGLRGTSNSDYNNRTTTTSWASTTAGTSSGATCRFNNTVYPASGLTFTWKPLYNPTNFASTFGDFDQIDLSWLKNSLNHNVMLAYNTTNTFGTPKHDTIYYPGYNITGGGTVLFYGNGTSFSHEGLDPNTTYYYKLWSYDEEPDYSSGVTTEMFIAYPLPYLQDFNASSTLPANWLSDMSVSTSTPHGLFGSRGLYKRIQSSASTAYAVTPLCGNVTVNTYLSFFYRIVNYSSYPQNATTLGTADKIEIQISTDNGSSFSTFHTIDYTNHVTSTEFANVSLNLAAYDEDLIKVRFLITWGSGDYYVDIDHVLISDGNNMAYVGATTEQPNTVKVGVGSSDNDIIRLLVMTQQSASPLSATSITMNTSGSTNATTDISAAKIYYTTGPDFSTAVQFGSNVSNPSGAFTVTGSQNLAQGTNYFWLAYDIKSTASAGNIVDGQCTQVVVSGSNNTPTIQNPDGSRPIVEVFSGTKSIPGDFASLAAAVTALNIGIVGSGGVTFNVAYNHAETITAAIILTATGTSDNPIVFQKYGGESNPLITAYVGANTTSDGIIKIAGSDYITFDGIDLLDPVSNNTNTLRMEWGYALVKKQASYPFDGCQNVTIKNCTITLQKANPNSVGIYAGNHIATSTTALTLIDATDAMNNCKFFNNNITNVYNGIEFTGFNAPSPYTLYNQGNEIGVSGGNTITNFGGLASTSYGIYTKYEASIKVANNSITGGAGTTVALHGVYLDAAASASADIYSNNITLGSSATTAAMTGITNTAGSTAAGNTINIYNNDVINCTYTTATSGTFTGIANAATAATVNIYGNEISNNVLPGTGLFTGIDGGGPAILNIYQNTINGNQKTGTSSGNFTSINYTTATSANINENEISANTMAGTGIFHGILGGNTADVNIFENDIFGNQKTGTQGYMYLVKPGISTIDFYDNDIYDNSFPNAPGSGTCQIYGYYNDVAATVENLHDNNIYNLTISGANTGTQTRTIGIFTSTVSSAIKNIYQNNIQGFSASNGLVHGISQTLGSMVNIYKNEIYDLLSSSTVSYDGTATGIVINSGANVYIYNNFISDLKMPVGNGGDGIRGISILSSQTNSTIGVYYNTIYLNASSTGTSFGNTGVYHTSSNVATTAALDLRNNIIINNSTQAGAMYYTVALRRSGSYLDNYLSTSDNNIYYAGTPGSNHLVYYHPNNSCQTIDSLRALVGPTRDSLSFSEIPPFINSTTAPYNLRLQDGAATLCESGGQPVISPIAISDDFDGATRPGTPDIGADEFAGISSYVEMPGAFIASSYNSQQNKLVFEGNSDDDDLVIVFNLTGNFTDPSGTPVAGQPLAGGTVLYIGTASPYIHTGLTPGTRVYYKIFSYSGSYYSLGRKSNAIPVVLPPANVSATGTTQTQIDLAWTKNASDHSVLIASRNTSVIGIPVNGTSYEVGNAIPGGGTVIFKGPASGFSHTGLTQWTQYFYKVWSYDPFNYYSVSIDKKAVTDSDPVTLPYLQNFDGTWSHDPPEPPGWNVVDADGSNMTWMRSTTSPHSAPASARGYEYQTADDYLISPPLVLPNTALQISWWDITTNSSPNSYKVLLSTTNKTISSFTINLGNFNCTNNTWQNHTIDLTLYKNQTVYIAFYQDYSTASGENFRIDDIFIETLIPGPATAPAPSDGLLTMIYPTLRWTAPASSFPILGYKVYHGTSSDPATLIYNGPNNSFQLGVLDNNSTYYWKVVPYNSYGEAINVPVWSYTTVTTTQLAESFEADYFPPTGWTWLYGWTDDNAQSYHGSQSARTYTFPDSPYPGIITPLLAIESGDKLEFFERVATKINNFIRIYYSTDKEDWTQLGNNIVATRSAWGYHVIDLTSLAGNNYYLRIEGYCYDFGDIDLLYIDHITGPDIVPVLPGPATNPDPYELADYISITPTLYWDPGISGGVPTGYKLYLDTNPNPVTLVYNNAGASFSPETLLNNTIYYWKVIPYNTVGDAPDCPVWSFKTIPELAVQIGTGYSVYPSLPISVSVDYSYTQTLYLQSEINIPDSRISKIYFEFSGGGGIPTYSMSEGEDGLPFKDWVIYMGHTDKSDFNSYTDWIPFEDLTEVFNGEVNIPDGYSWIEITLDVPFEYNNSDNLVIAVDENTLGAANPESCYFYGTDTTIVRALVYEDYIVNPDPESPPTAGAQVNGFANIRMQLEDVPTVPIFRVNPTSKAFGYVVLESESSPQTFTIRNNGVGILTINSIALTGTDDDQFQLTDTNDYPAELAAYEAIVVNVTFNPTTEGPKTASLSIAHSLTGSPAGVPLSGNGLDPVIDDFPFTETFEDDSPFRVLWTQFQEAGTGLWTYDQGADMSSFITEAHTGLLNARFTSTLEGNITKLVSPVFDLIGVTDPHLVFWYGQEYYYYPYQNELKVYYRTASDQSWVEIFYDNLSRSEWTPQVLALPNKTATYQLAFEGIDLGGFPNVLDDVKVGPPPEPEITIDPTENDFGNVLTGTNSYQQTFTIINLGPVLLTIDTVFINGTDATDFLLNDVNSYPVELDYGELIEVYVTFNPGSEGVKTATLEITSDATGSPHQASLSGTGLDGTISTFPFTETFEDASPSRDLWTQIQEYGTGLWTYANGAGGGIITDAHGGVLNARFTDIGEYDITKLVSPIFDLTGVTNPQVEFWYGQEAWEPDQNELYVYYRTASDQPWVDLFYDDTEKDQWTLQSLLLPNKSATYQIAFEGYDAYGYANVLDDITVGPSSSLTTTWYGSVSDDWTDPANWSADVPGPDHSVIIMPGTFYPIIISNVTVINIMVSPGADIIIGPGGILTITGN
jgi:hypothetical protein